MSRIYWDSMLFIYWLEENPEYSGRVAKLFQTYLSRGDQIYTSIVTIGEVLVVPIRHDDLISKARVDRFFASELVTVLPINRKVVEHFAAIRASTKVAPADALHLACAGAHSCEQFITNDKSLLRQKVPGIRSIGGLGVS